jgi:hypothetical protein
MESRRRASQGAERLSSNELIVGPPSHDDVRLGPLTATPHSSPIRPWPCVVAQTPERRGEADGRLWTGQTAVGCPGYDTLEAAFLSLTTGKRRVHVESVLVLWIGACTSDFRLRLNGAAVSYRVPHTAKLAPCVSHVLAFPPKTKHYIHSPHIDKAFSVSYSSVSIGAMAETNVNPVVFFDITLGGKC